MAGPLRNAINAILNMDANQIISAAPRPLQPLARAIRAVIDPFANLDDNNNTGPDTRPVSPKARSPGPESHLNPTKDKKTGMEVESVPVVETPNISPTKKGKRGQASSEKESKLNSKATEMEVESVPVVESPTVSPTDKNNRTRSTKTRLESTTMSKSAIMEDEDFPFKTPPPSHSYKSQQVSSIIPSVGEPAQTKPSSPQLPSCPLLSSRSSTTSTLRRKKVKKEGKPTTMTGDVDHTQMDSDSDADYVFPERPNGTRPAKIRLSARERETAEADLAEAMEDGFKKHWPVREEVDFDSGSRPSSTRATSRPTSIRNPTTKGGAGKTIGIDESAIIQPQRSPEEVAARQKLMDDWNAKQERDKADVGESSLEQYFNVKQNTEQPP